MPAFDPDAYLAQGSGSPAPFDPDAYLAQDKDIPAGFDPDAYLGQQTNKAEEPNQLRRKSSLSSVRLLTFH